MIEKLCLIVLFIFMLSCTQQNNTLVDKSVKNTKNKLSVLQEQISLCDLELDDLMVIGSYDDLYSAIDRRYLLFSDEIRVREMRYLSKNLNYKLRVNNDVISLFQVSEDGKVSPINVEVAKPIDAKQKIISIKGKIKQLTLNAQVEDDWGQYFEQRENGVQVEYSMRNSKITQLNIKMTKLNRALDCKLTNGSEVCVCIK